MPLQEKKMPVSHISLHRHPLLHNTRLILSTFCSKLEVDVFQELGTFLTSLSHAPCQGVASAIRSCRSGLTRSSPRERSKLPMARLRATAKVRRNFGA